MRIVSWNGYGGPEVLCVAQAEQPQAGPGQILVRIHATTVFAGDCEMRRSDILPLFWLPVRLMMGLFRPRRGKVLGQELAGSVVAVGDGVTGFSPGDEVLAPTSASLGAYADYIVLNADGPIARKPQSVSFGAAAALCVGGLNAWHFHQLAEIEAGQEVLLVGAGGSIGTLSLQLAKQAGARVTVVDSAEKLERLSALGADSGINFTQTPLSELDRQFDVVFNIHKYASFSDGLRLTRKGGRLLLMNIYLGQLLRRIGIERRTGKKVIIGMAGYDRQVLQILVDRVAEGQLQIPIDRHFSLDDIVEAHRYVDSDSKFGNVVIDVLDPHQS
jgi:NADPH:quinone reductase-like Zn-dependent oxidoreductase